MIKVNYFKGQSPKQEITDADIDRELSYMSKGLGIFTAMVAVGLLVLIILGNG